MLFKILLFLLISSFYAAYFAKQTALRKKGIQTNRLARGSKPQKTAAIEICLLVITYAIAIIQYAGLLGIRYLFPFALPTAVRWLGVVLSGSGVLFFILAITVMGDSWRAGVDQSQTTVMVTTGIYRFSRNPAFVGFDLLYIGTTLAMPGWVMVIAGAIGIALMHMQIIEEEKHLPSVFGEEYLQYRARVPRYLWIL